MRLLHLANFGSTNVGNGALIDGTERVIREDFPESVEFVSEPWDEYFIEGVPGSKKFDQTFVDKVNVCDALIVGGAVMFREDHIRFKMPVGIHKPVIFYGVSYRVWGYSDYYTMGGFGTDIIRSLSYPNCIFGVRNDGTEQWLWSKLGLHHEKIVTIPDPGLYVETVEERPWQIENKKINIVIALNDEDATERFGNKKAAVLQNIAKALVMFWEQDRNINVILCPHTFEDYGLMMALMMFFPLEMLYKNVVSAGVCRASQASKFYDLYRCADLILAMRIHAMVPAIGLGTPMIALSSQKRMTEFMKDCGLQDHCLIDVFQMDSKILCDVMKAHIKEAAGVRIVLGSLRARMRVRTKAFNEKIYNFIKEN